MVTCGCDPQKCPTLELSSYPIAFCSGPGPRSRSLQFAGVSSTVSTMTALLTSQALHTTVLLSPDEYLQPRKPVLPHVQAAGDASLGSAECTASCLHFDERPQTPDHQKKYRQSVLHEPGKIVRHFGVAEDPLPEGNFGRATIARPGESVAEYIKSYPQSGLAQWALQRAEDVYARWALLHFFSSSCHQHCSIANA